jgi:hypothetical protein
MPSPIAVRLPGVGAAGMAVAMMVVAMEGGVAAMAVLRLPSASLLQLGLPLQWPPQRLPLPRPRLRPWPWR